MQNNKFHGDLEYFRSLYFFSSSYKSSESQYYNIIFILIIEIIIEFRSNIIIISTQMCINI